MMFPLENPDLAMIRFVVFEEDSFGDGQFLGQTCYPIRCLRPGYRSVILRNEYSEELHLASLLVHVQFTNEKVRESSILLFALPLTVHSIFSGSNNQLTH